VDAITKLHFLSVSRPVNLQAHQRQLLDPSSSIITLSDLTLSPRSEFVTSVEIVAGPGGRYESAGANYD